MLSPIPPAPPRPAPPRPGVKPNTQNNPLTGPLPENLGQGASLDSLTALNLAGTQFS